MNAIAFLGLRGSLCRAMSISHTCVPTQARRLRPASGVGGGRISSASSFPQNKYSHASRENLNNTLWVQGVQRTSLLQHAVQLQVSSKRLQPTEGAQRPRHGWAPRQRRQPLPLRHLAVDVLKLFMKVAPFCWVDWQCTKNGRGLTFRTKFTVTIRADISIAMRGTIDLKGAKSQAPQLVSTCLLYCTRLPVYLCACSHGRRHAIHHCQTRCACA